MLTLLITCFIALARSGHIYSHDILISPNNISSASDITFIFTLETQLAPSDFLRIVLPFQLDSIQSTYWDAYINCSTSGPTKLAAASASTVTTDVVGAYFVQFYTDLTGTKLSGLAANVAYFVRITGTLTSAAAGINNPVQLFTVSNNEGNWITYDSNRLFGTLSLAAAATSQLNVTTSIPASETDRTVLGADYKVEIDISPGVTINNQARIDIELTNRDFALLSCQSVDAPDLNTSALPANFQPLNLYTLRATISETFSAANFPTYRFECLVRNPVEPATSNVKVTTKMGYIETIIETQTSTTELQSVAPVDGTLGWDETVHKVQLGWGYEASSASALPIFSLYRDASATEVWYQSVKTIFKPKSDLITTARLRINMSTVADTGFRILTATIHHNLPDFSTDEKVICTPQPEGVLTCDNVGQLQADTYFISFRFNIATGGTATTVPDFGKVSVQAFETSVVLLPLSATGMTNGFISDNVALFTNNGANGVIANSISKATSSESTYVTNGEDVVLKFGFNYFTSSVIPLTPAPTEINMGIEFYTSNALVSSVTPTCTIDTLTQDTDVIITDCGVDQSTQFTRLRFRLARFVRVTGPPATLFQAAPRAGVIRFDQVKFGANQFSSFNYVSENVYDYYARWVQGFTALTASITTATGSSPFFFNSIVYKDGGMANVQVGATFFANGATEGNIGTDFPTMIRVTGYLSPNEQVSADRLFLFFNDLEPLDLQNPCFGPTGIVCTYQENSIDNTQTNTLTDYSGSRRVVIDMDLTQRFNIYIPVKTTAGQSNIGFFVTTASSVDSLYPGSSSQGIFASQFSRRINQVSYASNAPTVADAAATTPKITIPTNTSISAVINTTIENIQGTYLIGTANTDTAFGAAYGYCANYDFNLQSGFALQPFYNSTVIPQELCVNLKYQASQTKQVTCQICPLQSPMVNNTVSVTNFKTPSFSGQDFLDGVYVVGTNDGNFQAAVRDNQATVLVPFSLTNVSITFAPLDFKKASRNIYATLNFSLAAPLPKSARINIIPSASLFMSPVSGVDCDLTTLDTTSCYASGSPSGIQFDVVIEDNAWPVGEHSIRFMVNADQATGITADTTVEYNVTILVDGIGAATTPLNALDHVSGIQNYTILNTANSGITLKNVSYLFGNKESKTVVSLAFDLPDDMIMYSGQSISFNLWGISASSATEVPSCIVKDGVTMKVSNSFASCNPSNLPEVILEPKDAVSGSFVLEVGFVLVPNSVMPPITAQITGVDRTTVIAENLPIAGLLLPTTPRSSLIPTANIQLRKSYTNPGSVAEITLAFRPSVSPIALRTNLYMYFPYYYAEKLGYKNLWCTANDLPVSCFIFGSWLLKVTSFPETIVVGQTVEIKIYGVITPQNSNAAGTIFIGLGNEENTFQLIEHLEIQDTASFASNPIALTIGASYLSNNRTRETTNLSFSFVTSETNYIRENQIISIDFPDQYGGTFRGEQGPKVRLSKTEDSTELAEIQSDAFGSRLKVTMPLDLDPMTSYTFTILEIETPDYPMCRMDRPTVSVMQAGETRAIFRTAPNIWDAYNFSFVNNPNFKALNWVNAGGELVMALSLTVGIMSPELRIIPPYGENFNVDISFTTSQTDLTILPASGAMIAQQGSPYLSLRLGAPVDATPRIIQLEFNKSEGANSNYYTKLPKIEVTLTNNKKTLPVNNIRIMKGGVSLPLMWELDVLELIPQTELKIEATIPDEFLSVLSIAGASTLTFRPDRPKAGFNFILSSEADVSNPPSITLSLDGVDQANYQLESTTVQFEIIDAIESAPVLSGFKNESGSNLTTEKFSFNLTQMGSVYWHVAYEKNLSTTDCLRVRDRYEGGAKFDPNSANQEQYGVFYVYDETQQGQFEIGNLLTNQIYSYILCPVNQLDYMATPISGTFKTKDNQASLFEVVVRFTRSINRDQLATLACLFARELQLPNANVVAMDGTTCSIPSSFINFGIFDYTRVSIFIQGNRRSNFNSTTRALLTQYITSITTQTPSHFLNLFSSTLQNMDLSRDFQSISLQAGPIYPFPIIDETAVVSVSVTDTTVTLSGLKLQSGEGIFYGVASDEALTLPTQSQIKSGVNSSNTAVVSSNVVYTSSPVTLTFTDLQPETDYIIYYFANSGDRTQYGRVSKVKFVHITTAQTRLIGNGVPRLEAKGMVMLIIAAIMILM